jgi:hypothetical protein
LNSLQFGLKDREEAVGEATQGQEIADLCRKTLFTPWTWLDATRQVASGRSWRDRFASTYLLILVEVGRYPDVQHYAVLSGSKIECGGKPNDKVLGAITKPSIIRHDDPTRQAWSAAG